MDPARDSPAQGAVIEAAIPEGVCCYFSGHPATIQGMADQYDLGYSQGLGAVEWVKANLGGTATIVSFILDHIEILIPRRQGTNDALAAGRIITLIEQELQRSTPTRASSSRARCSRRTRTSTSGSGRTTPSSASTRSSSPRSSTRRPRHPVRGMAGTEAGLAALESGTTFIREIYGFNNNVIGYARARDGGLVRGQAGPAADAGPLHPRHQPGAGGRVPRADGRRQEGLGAVYGGDYETRAWPCGARSATTRT